MAVASKLAFSESSNGRLIRLEDITTPGTLIHLTPTTNVKDIIHLYAQLLVTATSRTLSVEWGGTATLDIMTFSLGSGTLATGMLKIIDGFPLTTVSGLTVRAFATASDEVFIGGYVNRFT
ncbi:hypothetical protein LCGC14_3111890 [marine sediment metagenome]|uniref:Uncharacterized protein n=1 Tax=marine sediment metagenome TaxID=412755 RepID=A0A0F8YC76_9ZZZZ